ncbi:DUF3800 domain-containing protein [Lacticaseibacillus songhuajiangensis]|uniref:DUF3800 domain-containing protein n=1 Tax=Lacticaseibacillus songhuajiangensis TaxID=1296539 RepID=UPI000F7A43A8|nr:DUF3800 domain-containing protein [Lacticaseibacillus songhuajiangensis]
MEMYIFIDDAGQLHPNYPQSNFFVYAGFWCLSDSIDAIGKTYKVVHRQIFHTSKETKASSMTKSQKKQIIRRLLNKLDGKIHPIFESVYVPNINQVDFNNKQAVQLHKNYLILRLVEKAVREKRHDGETVSVSDVNVVMDNQSQTTLQNFDSIERYLNKRMHNEYKNSSFLLSPAPYKAKFQDSEQSAHIQICDIFANSKYEYHNKSFPALKTLLKSKNVQPPLKLPNKWRTDGCI